jgi:hypothetical protein
MKKKLLVCFWGQDKISSYLKNNPFMDKNYYEDKIITLNDLVINIKKNFDSYDIDFLWSTWSRCDIQKYEHNFKYILKHDEPKNFEEYLDSIDFPYVGQIRNDIDKYKKVRHGYFTQFFHKDKIINYLKDNNLNLKYNGLIFSRTDIYFMPKNNSIFNFNDNIIYIPEIYWGSRDIGVNDHIIIGNFNYVLNSINIDFNNLHNIIYSSHNIEQANAKILQKNNSIIQEFSCDIYCRFPLHMC